MKENNNEYDGCGLFNKELIKNQELSKSENIMFIKDGWIVEIQVPGFIPAQYFNNKGDKQNG